MKNILKFILAFSATLFLVNSCRDLADKDWTTPAGTLKLYDTSLGGGVLYDTQSSNPLVFAWQNTFDSNNSYMVEVSSTSAFAAATTVALGTSTTTTYNSTVGALNTAILKLGYSPYASNKVYVRVKSSSAVSNAIVFVVTPYPSSAPIITNPTAGMALVLDSKNPTSVATTVKWTDYASYGVPANYLIEVATHGGTNWQSAGTTTDLKTFDWTNKVLNDAVLKTGAVPGTAANIDVRVTVTTTSTGGTITKTSDVVAFMVTPYVAFKNLFLVGDATAAFWDPNNNNQALFRDPSNTNKFYFTGKFGTSMFKLLEVLGNWQPQWGLKAGVVAVNDGTSSDPDPFMVSTGGYYSFTVDISAKTYTITPYTGTMTNYSTMGLIGSATANGWGGDTLMTQSTFDPHQWYIKGVTLTAAEVKFRANADWGLSWGDTTEFSGKGLPGGPNIPVTQAGTYNVYFNDLDGRYQFIKQ